MGNRKRINLVAVICLLLGMLSGCGAKSEANGAITQGYAPEAAYREDFLYDSADSVVAESKAPSKAETGNGGVQNQKLIRTMHVEAETDDLDTMLANLDARIRELGGYVENKSIYNGSYSNKNTYRTATLTIRIPVDQLDGFLNHVQGLTNITSQKETADDITLSYVATASRITALETAQQRLRELLAKAENMADLLMIEQRLTDVRTELEEVTSQLRLYDNLVDYGTVHLSVTQVKEYTVVEEETIWQRMGKGLAENWKDLCETAEDLLVLIVVSLPYLIPIGLAGLLVFIVVRLATRPKKQKPQQPQAEQ